MTRNLTITDRRQGDPQVHSVRTAVEVLDGYDQIQAKGNRGADANKEILQFKANHYVPLGFLGPVILWWKLFLQKLRKSGYQWDEELTLSE